MLFLEIFLLKLILDRPESVIDLNDATSLRFELFLFSRWVFVGVLDAKLGHENAHIQVIADLLTIEKQFLHLETALAEVFVMVEISILVFTQINSAEVVIFVFISLLVLFLLWGFNGLRIVSSEFNCLSYKSLHNEDI